MNCAIIRSVVRTQPPCVLFSVNQLRPMTSEVRIKQQVTTVYCEKDEHQNLDKVEELISDDEHGDVMSHSFGEGYATRCDEEGFGGIYGGNQSSCDTKRKVGKKILENHPSYDKNQGSEVKEKEKGRHQTTASS